MSIIKTRRGILGGLIAAVAVHARPSSSNSQSLLRAPFLRWQNENRLQIGMNCFQPFGFGYPFTNGDGNDAAIMPKARLAKLRNTGFDFVRMVIDPEPLLAADNASNEVTTQLDSRIAEIIVGIERRVNADLKVILDFHFHGQMVSYLPGWAYTDVFYDATKGARLGFVLARVAAAIHAAAHTSCPADMVSFELFNEPPAPSLVSTASYIKQISAWWMQVRTVMPLHTIIVAGNNLNAIDGTPAGTASGLTSLSASHFDQNTGFAIHPYASPVFTHQAVSGTIFQYAHNIKFPAADNGSERAVKKAFRIAAANDSEAIRAVVQRDYQYSSIHQFYATYGSKSALAQLLAIATSWTDRVGKSRKYIFNTEFGVNFAGAEDADEVSAANYVRTMREISDAAGINCIVIHEMQGSDFGIQDKSAPWAFNASIQNALFPESIR